MDAGTPGGEEGVTIMDTRTPGEGICPVFLWPFQNVKNPQAFCVYAVASDGRGI